MLWRIAGSVPALIHIFSALLVYDFSPVPDSISAALHYQ